MNILIVEDEELNRMVVEEMVTMLYPDFHMIMANNGAEALEILEKERADIILSDINMPVMNGYEFVKEVKNTRKLDIPMIAITAAALMGEREKLLESGYDDYVSKPIEFDALKTALSRYCT